MNEHRRFIRLNAPIGVLYRLKKKSRKVREVATLLRNLSGGGIRMTTKGELRQGDIVELSIEIPLVEDPVRATGEIVWARSLEAGVRFVDIRSRSLREVLDYVHHVGIG